MKIKLILFVSILIYGCQRVDINNAEKRNENWVYWVDASTGEASWIKFSGGQTSVKNGRYTLFYKNGEIYEKGKLKNGKNVDTIFCFNLKGNLIKYKLVLPDTLMHYYIKNGPYIAYFQNGKVFEKGTVKEHKKENKWIRYSKKGYIDCIQNLENGTGSICWYYENGQISDSNYYNKDKIQGQIKLWYKNGQIKEISNWKDNIQNGVYETYYENGNPNQKVNWINGKLDGKSESWYENGQKRSISYNKCGLRDGNTKQWYSNGKMQLDAFFTLGKKNGRVIKYYENGTIQVDGTYKNDLIDGICIRYDKKGKEIKKDFFIDGKISAKK